jgi:CheY-like chemotaxis protein
MEPCFSLPLATAHSSSQIPPSLAALFRSEARTLIEALTRGLRDLLRDAEACGASESIGTLESKRLDDCRRAAHSLRGAAAVVGLRATSNLAATLENAFVDALAGRGLAPSHIHDLLRALEVLRSLVESMLPAPAGEGERADRRGGRGPRVLVVDDSRMAREHSRRALVERGYEVETAADGLEAWSLLRTRPFELVVTDAEMPGMRGVELLQRVRADESLAALPVILVTGRELPSASRQQIGQLAVRVLLKRFGGEDDLLDAAAELLADDEARSA